MSETTIYDVPAAWAEKAWVNAAEYATLYAASIADSDGFWAEHGKRIDWFKPYTKVKNASYAPGEVSIKWFEDGVTNAAYNCIDRHLATRAGQTAIIWEGDDPSESKTITYGQLHEEVGPGPTHPDRSHTEPILDAVRRLGALGRRGGEVHLDPAVIAASAGQLTTASMKASCLARIEVTLVPEHVRARERRVTAQIHLGRGREPAEVVSLLVPDEKGRFGEIHLARDVLHPPIGRRLVEDADGGRIPGERPVREGIHLGDLQWHDDSEFTVPGPASSTARR